MQVLVYLPPVKCIEWTHSVACVNEWNGIRLCTQGVVRHQTSPVRRRKLIQKERFPKTKVSTATVAENYLWTFRGNNSGCAVVFAA